MALNQVAAQRLKQPIRLTAESLEQPITQWVGRVAVLKNLQPTKGNGIVATNAQLFLDSLKIGREQLRLNPEKAAQVASDIGAAHKELGISEAIKHVRQVSFGGLLQLMDNAGSGGNRTRYAIGSEFARRMDTVPKRLKGMAALNQNGNPYNRGFVAASLRLQRGQHGVSNVLFAPLKSIEPGTSLRKWVSSLVQTLQTLRAGA